MAYKETIVDECVKTMMAEVPVGRAGWKRDAEFRIRREVLDRYHKWMEAERNFQSLQALKAAREAVLLQYNESKTITFDEPHGRSYFGSGGGWARKPVAENMEVARWGDDGFVRGPISWRVVDPEKPASVTLVGGDCIGEGRKWRYEARWVPGIGWQDCRGVRGI